MVVYMKIPLFGGHAIRIESPVKWMKDWYGMVHPKPDVWKLVVEEIKASLVKKAPPRRSSFPWIGQNVLVARLHDYVIKGLEKCSPIGRSKPESEMKPFGFTIAINRAMYCRWELALLLAHWPSTDKARRKLIDEAFKRTDALLGHLADILDAAEPAVCGSSCGRQTSPAETRMLPWAPQGPGYRGRGSAAGSCRSAGRVYALMFCGWVKAMSL